MHEYEGFRSAVMQVLGGAPDHIEPGRIMRFATDSRRTKKSGWCLAFDDGVIGGVFGDFRTGVKSEWWQRGATRPSAADLHQWRERVQAAAEQARRAKQQEWATARERNERLWREARTIRADDPVGTYLRGRGLVMDQYPEALRYHPRVGYYRDCKLVEYFPAMLGLVTNEGMPVCIHRTYLTHDARKAAVEEVKKLTKASGPVAGSCIQLGFPQRRELGVAEGIETALAAMLASGIPTVAAISASNMARYSFPPEETLDALTIFADNDRNEVGQAAASTLENRALARGLAVRKLIPAEMGLDWADVWAIAGGVDE